MRCIIQLGLVSVRMPLGSRALRPGSSMLGPNFPVSGSVETDSEATAREKIRAALRRWHPDKWAARIAEDANLAPKLVAVTRRLLDEKARIGQQFAHPVASTQL